MYARAKRLAAAALLRYQCSIKLRVCFKIILPKNCDIILINNIFFGCSGSRNCFPGQWAMSFNKCPQKNSAALFETDVCPARNFNEGSRFLIGNQGVSTRHFLIESLRVKCRGMFPSENVYRLTLVGFPIDCVISLSCGGQGLGCVVAVSDQGGVCRLA